MIRTDGSNSGMVKSAQMAFTSLPLPPFGPSTFALVLLERELSSREPYPWAG